MITQAVSGSPRGIASWLAGTGHAKSAEESRKQRTIQFITGKESLGNMKMTTSWRYAGNATKSDRGRKTHGWNFF